MLSAEDYRKIFGEADRKRDKGLCTPQNIERVDNLSYGIHGADNLLDVYLKKGVDILQPTIVNIHGGAWVAGEKSSYQFYCMDLAQRGFTVINFDYRRAPEAAFPAALEDINQVFHWIMKYGKNYHVDTNQLFLVGDSAGAQMASQYVTILTNPVFAKLFSFEFPAKLNIRACALNCGVYDVSRYALTDEEAPIHYYIGKMTEEKLKQLDTISYMTSAFPPTYVVSANRDFLLANAEPMYDKLQQLGVKSEVKIYGTEESPRGHVFHLDIRDEQATKCNDLECDFFRQFIF